MFTRECLLVTRMMGLLAVVIGLGMTPGVVRGVDSILPPQDSPRPGDDSFDSAAELTLDLGTGVDETLSFVGPVCVGRGVPICNADGCWEIPTIMKTGCLRVDHPVLGEILGSAVVPAGATGDVCLTLALPGPTGDLCGRVIATSGPVPVVDGQAPGVTAQLLCRALRKALREARCKCTVRCYGPFIEVCCRTHVHEVVCCLTGTDIPAPGIPLGALGPPGPVAGVPNLGQRFRKGHKLRRIPWRPHVNQETEGLVVIDIPGFTPGPIEIPMRGPSMVAVGGHPQQQATVPIELVVLSLRSTAPIQLGDPSAPGEAGGTPDSFFDIFVDLGEDRSTCLVFPDS